MRLRRQFIRFVVVGVVSNAIGYACYLLLTQLGVGHKSAMTCVYALGVTQSFVGNRRWSFGYQGSAAPALVRFVGVYALGFLLNLSVMYVAVDRFGLPHELVQLVMVGVVAGFLFVSLRVWVFALPETGTSGK